MFIYRGTASGSEGAVPVAALAVVTSYRDTAVASGVTYYYFIVAVNSVGEGGPSSEVSATAR